MIKQLLILAGASLSVSWASSASQLAIAVISQPAVRHLLFTTDSRPTLIPFYRTLRASGHINEHDPKAKLRGELLLAAASPKHKLLGLLQTSRGSSTLEECLAEGLPLFQAAQHGNHMEVEWICAEYAVSSAHLNTGLVLARAHVETVKTLLDCNRELPLDSGTTKHLLNWAAFKGREDLMGLLLADPRFQADQLTLKIAFIGMEDCKTFNQAKKHTEVITRLLHAGLKPEGKYPLKVIMKSGQGHLLQPYYTPQEIAEVKAELGTKREEGAQSDLETVAVMLMHEAAIDLGLEGFIQEQVGLKEPADEMAAFLSAI